MEELAMEVRRLVYTVICFQCLIQLTEGSAYQKYLKLFSYLLTMCICCNVVFSFVGQVEKGFFEADALYAKWEKEWREMTRTDDIRQGEAYYEQKLWEDKIIGGAQAEYDSRGGGEGNGGEICEQASDVPERGSEGNGRPTKETMLIVFLSGILIFVIMLPTNKSNSSYSKKKSQGAESTISTGNMENLQQENGGNSGSAAEQYRKGLEKELEEFLSSVAGVGDVKVLIYMKNSQEYVVEKDIPTSSSTSGESSELRKEEATVYTRNADGNEVPFISQTKSPEIDGVVVAAKGAADEGIRLQIVKLVMALYGVEANKVEVLRME